MGIIKHNICNGCGSVVKHGDTVSALLKVDVTGSGVTGEKIRLKLSENSIYTRAIKIFCKNCLETELYI